MIGTWLNISRRLVIENQYSLYQFVQRFVSPFVNRYSRLEVKGLENLTPNGEGALLACNHSGSFWWDALCLIAGAGDRQVNFVAHHWDAKIGVMRRLLENFGCGFLDENIDDISENSGIVDAVRSGGVMCIYPEESYHTFRDRYTLFRFSPHIAKYADIAKVPIIPVTIIGVEEAAATYFGPKFKNVPLHIPLHPPLILPFKVTIEIGKPYYCKDLIAKSENTINKTLTNKEDDYVEAAENLRSIMYDTMSKYKTCKMSDEPYIERSAWI